MKFLFVNKIALCVIYIEIKLNIHLYREEKKMVEEWTFKSFKQ